MTPTCYLVCVKFQHSSAELPDTEWSCEICTEQHGLASNAYDQWVLRGNCLNVQFFSWHILGGFRRLFPGPILTWDEFTQVVSGPYEAHVLHDVILYALQAHLRTVWSQEPGPVTPNEEQPV